MENKQKNISLSYGIHRTPSLGKDGELSECVNLIPKNGELVNIAAPEAVDLELPEGAVFMCKHKIYSSKEAHYISYNKADGRLYYQKIGDSSQDAVMFATITLVNNIVSSGNTLIAFREEPEGMMFYLWDKSSYRALGDWLPEIPVQFGLKTEKKTTKVNTGALQYYDYNEANLLRAFVSVTPGSQGGTRETTSRAINTRTYSSWDNAGRTARRQAISDAIERNHFVLPFFVRYAIRLYDGTLAMWSPPVLMVPNTIPMIFVRNNYYKHNIDDEWQEKYPESMSWTDGAYTSYDLDCTVEEGTLDYSALLPPTELQAIKDTWGDIIASIDIYVTPGMYFYNDDREITNYDGQANYAASQVEGLDINMTKFKERVVEDFSIPQIRISKNSAETYYRYAERTDFGAIYKWMHSVNDGFQTWVGLIYLEYPIYSKAEIQDIVSKQSQFYFLSSIKLSELSTSRTDVPIYENRLRYLTQTSAAEGMSSVGDIIKPIKGLEYNSRLFYYDLIRSLRLDRMSPGLFIPFTNAPGEETEWGGQFALQVKMSAGMDEKIIGPRKNVDGEWEPIRVTASTNRNDSLIYIFIPASGSETVDTAYCNFSALRNHDGEVIRYPNLTGRAALVKSPVLPGYYWFNFFSQLEKNYYGLLDYSGDADVRETNKIYVSNVSNPFNVSEVNSVQINVGSILKISTIFRALSPGQYGQFDLYAFTDTGTYSISLTKEGLIETVKPISSDVCVNGNAITQTDNGIVFPTAQGLKFITGSDIRLLSSPVEGFNPNDLDFRLPEGHPLEEFNGLLTRDNNDFVQMIQDSNTRILYDYAQQLIHIFTGEEKHYCYSLESGEWAQQRFEVSNYFMPTAIVPTYPLSVMQFGQHLYEYTGVKNSAPFPELPTLRPGIAITRPIALEDPTTMTALMDLRLIGQRTRDGIIRRIALYGSRDGYRWHPVRSLKHGSFKYYRFVIYSSMTDYDTLSGISVIYQPRRNHKLR